MAVTRRALDIAADEDETATPCPACGGQRFEILLGPQEVEGERRWLRRFYRERSSGDDKDRSDFTQSEPTYIVACCECGTVLRNPRPAPEKLERRYASDEYGRETLERLLDSERDFFLEKAERFRATLPPRSRVLEVGSFVGAFLLAARAMGWEAEGVDIGEETSAFCREQGLRVRNCDLAVLSGSFEAAFVWNTFDQLADPRGTLALLRNLLPSGGLLVIRIPNGAFESAALDLRRTRERSRDRVLRAMAYNNFVTFPYLAGYTPRSVRRLLDSEGFGVESISGDTILPLMDDDCPEFAMREEARYKRAVIRACGLSGGDEALWPWLDVVSRKR